MAVALLQFNKLFHSIKMYLKNLDCFGCIFRLNIFLTQIKSYSLISQNVFGQNCFVDLIFHKHGIMIKCLPAICEILANFLLAYFFLTAISFPFSFALDVFTSKVAKSAMFSLIDSKGQLAQYATVGFQRSWIVLVSSLSSN